MPREPADVHLVDYGRGEGLAQLGVALPVVRVGMRSRSRMANLLLSPDRLAATRAYRRARRRRVHKDRGGGPLRDRSEAPRRLRRGRPRGTRTPVRARRVRTRASNVRRCLPASGQITRAGSSQALQSSRSSSAGWPDWEDGKFTPPSTGVAPGSSARARRSCLPGAGSTCHGGLPVTPSESAGFGPHALSASVRRTLTGASACCPTSSGDLGHVVAVPGDVLLVLHELVADRLLGVRGAC
jgi:hypothetical protein